MGRPTEFAHVRGSGSSGRSNEHYRVTTAGRSRGESNNTLAFAPNPSPASNLNQTRSLFMIPPTKNVAGS